MKTQRLTRQSLRGTEYQIEYTLVPKGSACEYRARRGTCGAWTKWIETAKLREVLRNLGFESNAVHIVLSDYAFEALFSRGEIILSKGVVQRLASTAGMNAISSQLYSSVKSVGDEWVLHSSAVANPDAFRHLWWIINSQLK
jgi:hypothetical protein